MSKWIAVVTATIMSVFLYSANLALIYLLTAMFLSLTGLDFIIRHENPNGVSVVSDWFFLLVNTFACIVIVLVSYGISEFFEKEKE